MKRFLALVLLIIPFIGFSQMGSIALPDRPIPHPATPNEAVVKWNTSQPGYHQLTNDAKEFYYWVNLGRSQPEQFWDSVVAPVLRAFPILKGEDANSLRADMKKAGALPMFSLSQKLVKTAQAHADDIAGKRANPSHTSTDGTDFGTRMKRAEVRTCANENIAVSSNSTLLSVLLLYLDIGLPEKGHRKALLNPSLKETGVGSAKYGPDQDFFVQDLSCGQY